jgi:hypothetical protein
MKILMGTVFISAVAERRGGTTQKDRTLR